MIDPDVDPVDAWADKHPLAARSVQVAFGWAVLVFAGWVVSMVPILGPPIGIVLTFMAFVLAIGWALILAYVNRDRVQPLTMALRALWDRAWAFAVSLLRRDVRPYRFAGEQANHLDQLQGTKGEIARVAALMAKPDMAPEEQRVVTDSEHGLEERLTVLLLKPRLTLEEKRERDAIQAMLRDLRGAAVATPEALGARPMALFGPVGPAAGLLSGWKIWALGLAVALSGWGMNFATAARLDHAKNDLTRVRSERDEEHRQRLAAQAYAAAASKAVADAQASARASADTIENERRISRRARQEAERIRHALEQARLGGAPDYGFGGVQPRTNGRDAVGGAGAARDPG